MNAKISVFAIFVETIAYLLLYNLHGCTFKMEFTTFRQKMVPEIFSKITHGKTCG